MFFKPTFCPKNAQKSKSCSRLPEPERDVPVCPNAKSCSKVAGHNWDRPTSQILGRPQANMTLWDFVRLWICKSRENVWKYTIHTSWIPFFDKIEMTRLVFTVSSGAPNVNFREISVRKTISDLEFSKHLLLNFLIACLFQDFQTYKKWYNCPFLTDFLP